MLCTLSSAEDTKGFPASSVVELACDGSGRPFFSTSTLSAHTHDMVADGRVSLTVKSPNFQVRLPALRPAGICRGCRGLQGLGG